MVNINIQKKDLWLLSAIMVFLVGVAVVVAYGSGDSTVHGHDAGEVEGVGFGDWVDVTTVASGGATQGPVLSDGFVVVASKGSWHGFGYILGFSDTNNPPTTRRVGSGSGYVDVHWNGITMPVKKGDYWRLVFNHMGQISIYWIPSGS